MGFERIIDLTQLTELSKENPLLLDAQIGTLNSTLLYEDIPEDLEIAGYRYLRRFTVYPDKYVRWSAAKALDNRWNKIGFYTFEPPVRDFPGNESKDRSHYQNVAESVDLQLSDNVKLAIIGLTRWMIAEDTSYLSASGFEQMMASLAGPHTKSQNVLSTLQKLLLLTNKADFVPLLDIKKQKIRLTPEAFKLLRPHLSVLEAISYPEEAIPLTDYQLIQTINKGIAMIRENTERFWQSKTTSEVMIHEDNRFQLADVAHMQFDADSLDLDEVDPLNSRGIVTLLSGKGKLYRLSHGFNPKGRFFSAREEITISQPPPEAKAHHLFNFWGKQIVGKEVASLILTKHHDDQEDIEISGELAIEALPGEDAPDVISLSPKDMSVSWSDISGKEKGMHLAIHYQKPYGPVIEIGTESQIRDTYISSNASSITVLTTNEVRATRKRKSASYGSGPDTKPLRIPLGKDNDTLEIKHPKGRYTLSYSQSAGILTIVCKGKSWEKTVVMPMNLNPVIMLNHAHRQHSSILSQFEADKDRIEQQIKERKQIGLAQTAALNYSEQLSPSSRKEEIMTAYKESQTYHQLQQIDEALSQLDPRSRNYAKYYISSLIFERDNQRSSHEEPETGLKREDRRLFFRSFIASRGVIIPEEILSLIETTFY